MSTFSRHFSKRKMLKIQVKMT